MARNNDTPIIQDGDAEITGQLQAGSVAIQDRVLSEINAKLAVDGSVLVTEAQRNAINGYAGLDQNGKLLAAVLPEISISRVYVVASEAAQLALQADEGDLAIRSDLSRSFVHTGASTGTLSDWLELARTSDHVYSVAGRVGAVELDNNDIIGLNAALAGKSNVGHTHTTSDITNAGNVVTRNTPTSGNASSSEVVLGSDTRLSDTRDPKSHTHPISDVNNLQSSLDSKSNTGHTHTASEITDAGNVITKSAPTSGDATSGQVVLGSDTRLSDSRTPNPHNHLISDVTGLQGTLDTLATANHTHTLSQITDSGTAAAKNAPTSGNASSTEVVLGSDTRLTDARTPTSHTHPASEVTGLEDAVASKQNLSEKNQANGYAGLDASGKIQASSLPAIAVTDVYVVASQPAQLVLDVQEGDVVVRTDLSKTFIHNGGTAGTMSDWTEIVAPPNLVQSVAGKTGSVTLGTSDIIGLNTAISNLQSDINGKAPISHKSNHALTGGTNEIQLLVVSGNDGTGSFTLTFNGQTTSAISVPASTSSIKSALESLSNIGAGNVTVALYSGQSYAFTVTFVNTLGKINQPQITTDGSGITGGGSVYVQTSPPTGSTNSLWINSANNTTYIWSGTSWIAFGATPPYETLGSSQVKTVGMTLTQGAASAPGPDPLYPADIGAAEAVHTHTVSQVTDAGTAASRNVPTSGNASSSQVVLGSDTRLTDSRTPTAHKTSHATGGSDELTPSDIGAAASSHTHSQSDVSGLTSALSGKVDTSDSRLTDARTPTAHKSTHATGGSDALSPSDIGAASSSHTHTLSNITDAGTAASKNVASTGNASSTQVVMGNDTRLRPSGIYMWGSGSVGGTGQGQFVNTPFISLTLSKTCQSISIGNQTSGAIGSDGTMWTWGNNNGGVLGRNISSTTLDYSSVPTQVGTSTNWKEISIGGNAFACALTTAGELYTWGSASSQANGLSWSTTYMEPTRNGTDTNWSAISAGIYSAFAIKTDRTLWAWGLNTSGHLGVGASKVSPTQVGTDTNWQSVSVGGTHTLAIKTDGTLWGWGEATNGRLGNNTTTPNISSPVQIGTDTDWKVVSAGYTHSLAIKTDGTLWSWGAAANGRLGNNTTTPDVLVPTKVNARTDWTDIKAGYGNLLAVRNGCLFMAGNGANNSFGQGTTTSYNTLVCVSEFGVIKSIASDLFNSCHGFYSA